MSETITKVLYREENGVRIHKIVKIKPGDPTYEAELTAKKEFQSKQSQLIRK